MNKHTTLITGAGKRIGAQVARHLARQSHQLVLHYHRSKGEAETLAKELGAILVQADLSDPSSLADFWKGLPPVTNLIHNASLYQRDTLVSMMPENLRAHLAVNLESPLVLTQGFLKQLPKDAAGNVIVLGDDALGWSASPEFFGYSISKHAWRSVIDLIAASLAPHARANLIALAPTLMGETDTKEMFERLANRAPLQRTGSVKEVLTAIDFVLKSPGLTGQVIGLGNGMALATSRP